ncbi:MAG: cytochrome c oxidase assembly protein [Pseudomonadota bacterium]
MTNERPTPVLRRRDFVVAGCAAGFAAFMVGMAYAAVPLYDWFCRATGFNGTTQVSTAAPAPGEILDRKITIRFDANVGGGLPWRFEPEQNSIQVKIGEVVTVNYLVINQSARETTGLAAYNVSPLNIGSYFHKINCFCFTDQTLKAGEKRELAVVFYIDPSIMKDDDGADLSTITLSYSFYPQREPQRPVADNASAGKPGRI